MTYLIDTLRLQVQTAKPDIFVLTTSQLNGYKLGGAAEAEGYDPNTEWMDILGETLSINIRRGAKRGDSIQTEVEVGTLEARVYDGNLDPNSNPYIKMGVPVRLQALKDGLWVSQYTGVISRVAVSYGADRKPTVTLYATDAVKDLANINRAGVVAGTFAERVDDLLSKHGIAFNVTGGVSSLADNNYESTLVNHLMLAQNSELGYVFVDKENVVQAYGRGSLPTIGTVLEFSDTYQEYDTNIMDGDTARGGDLTFGTGGMEPFWGTMSYSTERAWQGFGSYKFIRDITPGSYVRFTSRKARVTEGKTYTASVYAYHEPSVDTLQYWHVLRWFDAAGTQIGQNFVSDTQVQGEWQRHVVTATAPAGAVYAAIVMNSATATTVLNTMFFDGYQLEEGSTVSPFNFPNRAYYNDIAVNYDDAQMFNDVFVRNLTRGVDEEMNYTSIETVYGPYRNVTSVATWGSRQTEVITNLTTEEDIEEYAAVVLDEFDAPELRVETVRWNATEHVDKAAYLELYDMVQVEYSSETASINKPFRVLAIEHDITPDAWMVTVDLLDAGL